MKKWIAWLLALALALTLVSALAEAEEYTDKETVRQVQQALNDAGYNCGTPDGSAGKNTRRAITEFQTDHGLEPTGLIDDALLVALGLKEGEAMELDLVIGDGSDFTLTLHDAAVPFAPVQWGATPQEVLAAISGSGEAGGDIAAKVAIPGMDEPLPIRFHFAAGALAGVTVTVRGGVTTAANYEEDPAGPQLNGVLLAYYAEDDANVRLSISDNDNVRRGWKSGVTDAVVGYIQEDGAYRLGVEFRPSAAFDEASIRSGSLFSTMLNGGSTIYATDVSRMIPFRTDYSKDERYDQTPNCVSSRVRMLGSNLTLSNALPIYDLAITYGGLVDPSGVEAFTFTVDGTLYQFTRFMSSKTEVTQYRDYMRQFFIPIGIANAPFMEALASARNPVKLEIRGGNFLLTYEIPKKVRAAVVEDWELFKKAGGTGWFFSRITGETPMLTR